MNETIGKLVESTKGRDNGKIYMIYSSTSKSVTLVDGDARRIVNPKVKNIKHIKFLDVQSDIIKNKILDNRKVFDSEIYSFIKNFKNTLKF